MPDTYGLHVKFSAHQGKRDALLKDLSGTAEVIVDLPGCKLYMVSVSPTDPDSVFMTEVWESQAEHDASLRGTEGGVPRTCPKGTPPCRRIS